MGFIEEQIEKNIANRVAIEKSTGKEFTESDCLDLLEKAGKAAQMGEVRTWGGKEYIKTPKGWRPKPKGYKDGSGKKEEQKKDSKDLSKKRDNLLYNIGEIDRMEREMKNLENLMWDDDYTDDDEFEAELEWGDEYDQLAEDLEKLQRKTKKEIRSFMKESNPSWKPTKNADLSDLISEFKKEHGPKDKGNLPSDAKKVMNALAGVNPKYKDPNLVQVEATPKGNWAVYYDGKYTGTTINGVVLSDATVEKLGWEYHNID